MNAPQKIDRLFTETLANSDPNLFATIMGELGRQRNEIELIASENIVSGAVLEAQGSVLTNKPPKAIPEDAITTAVDGSMWRKIWRLHAKQLFSCDFANV